MNKKNLSRTIGILAVLLLIFIIVKCSSGNNKESNDDTKDAKDAKEISAPKDNLNVSIFLDLSDHLDTKKTPQNRTYLGNFAYENYIDYAKEIAETQMDYYTNSGKRLRAFNEKIKIHVDPYPEYPEINGLIKSSEITLTRDNATLKEIKSIPETIANNAQSIIELSLDQYNGTDDWPGSDINAFFEKGSFYDENKKNVLFIFTDGYPYHEDRRGREKEWFLPKSPKWKSDLHNETNPYSMLKDKNIGLSPVNSDLKNLKVMLLGIRPSELNGNDYELELMKAIWIDWLENMGVPKDNIEFKQMKNTSLSELGNDVSKFLIFE